jgi:putative ABC transport system permease protein
MRAAWRLAINSLSARRNRTALLIACVALCALLVCAVACALSTIDHNLNSRVTQTVGAGDARVTRPGQARFDASLVGAFAKLPQVKLASGRWAEPLPLETIAAPGATSNSGVALGYGIDPSRENKLRPLEMAEGRPIERTGEVVIDSRLRDTLKCKLGDTLKVSRLGDEITLKVVGISRAPALGGIFTQQPAYITLEQMSTIAGLSVRISELDLVLNEGVDPEKFVREQREMVRAIDDKLLLQTSARVTANFRESQKSGQIGQVLVSILSFLAASFIIMTGLTTGVSERTRELAILRCIGADRGTLAWSQLFIGAIVGVLGAIVGVPLGVLAAWVLTTIYHEQLPAGFQPAWITVPFAFACAVASGIVGASWSAIVAARTSPLQGLSTRSRAVAPKWLWVCIALGVLCPLGHVAIALNLAKIPYYFWVYVLAGYPLMFIGYFALGVPVMKLVVRFGAPIVSRMLGLPRKLLGRTVAATPYRHGFTASAMMVGLALLTVIWTNGRAVMLDWVDSLKFPDFFVMGLNLPEDAERRVAQVPGVDKTCAITSHNVAISVVRDGKEEAAFNVRGLAKYNSTFIAFDPTTFFDMTKLTWVQGDPATAIPKLNKGGSVLVAREFLQARGIGVGEVLTVKSGERSAKFEVVGVVSSPGLDIASKFFSVGEDYLDQAVNSIFGSQRDLREKLGVSGVNLVQGSFVAGADHAQVIKELKQLRGVLEAGDGAAIKNEIRGFLGVSVTVASIVAVGAMLVACFGVANVIVAGVQARTFEFGVLLAVGSSRGLLARMVLGEALLIAIGACVLGTLLGLQIAWGGQLITERMIGIVLHFVAPWGALAMGWVILTLITLGAAFAPALNLARQRPRELIGAMKG